MAQYMAIIDGTGQWNDGDYAIDMAGSFCAQLKLKLGNRAQYDRGPSVSGMEVGSLAEQAALYLGERWRQERASLYLAGYSRGGSAALIAAERLRLMGIPVAGLILFDPVAKHPYKVPGRIPGNVARTIAFKRKLDSDFVTLCEDTAGDIGGGKPGSSSSSSSMVPDMVRNSPEFQMLNLATTMLGNMANQAASNAMKTASKAVAGEWVNNLARPGWTERFEPMPKGDHVVHAVTGTHGALGGVGSAAKPRILDIDRRAQAEVAEKVTHTLKRWGFNFRIHSIGPIPPQA